MADAAPASAPPQPHGRGPAWTRAAIAAILLAALLLAGGKWLVQRWTHVLIDDARVGAELVTLSSEVGGRIARIGVTAGDKVAAGAEMVRIESAQTALELRMLEAQEAAIGAQRDQLRAQQSLLRAQLGFRLEAADAQGAAAEATHRASQAATERARGQFARVSALADRAVTSRQLFDDAQAALTLARQQELAAAAGVAQARANRAALQAEEAQILVLDHQIAALVAQIAALHVQQAHKRLDLEKRAITAAFAGVVDAVFVDPGEYVATGTRLLIYHDPARIWIDANVKETDFRRLKLGARATIRVDAYPDLVLDGSIERLGHAATSQFALLPSPNPSGNFTKVTQRLPVRVAVAQREQMLRPGMMVEVSVDVVD